MTPSLPPSKALPVVKLNGLSLVKSMVAQNQKMPPILSLLFHRARNLDSGRLRKLTDARTSPAAEEITEELGHER